ncbi:hypothetical protein [Streptomyces rimosus]|nr:hypothetical protein [Streptomyces rimosus]
MWSVRTTSAWASILVCAGVAEWFIAQRTLRPLADGHRPVGVGAAVDRE